MSRIGRLPVNIPSSVQITINNSEVQVKGQKGELKFLFSPSMDIALEENQVVVRRSSDDPSVRALHGTTRAVIQNMVTGVSDGFTKILQVDGVGYRPEMNGKNLVLHVGYSHPVEVTPPEGIEFEVDTKIRQIKVSGFDKQVVGQVAVDIRGVRPPEPYKGKGIRYIDERIRRKAGKSGKTA
ncbi:MAG: 50S ribosomal protein L6 [Anaerolineaceae bacterium]|nr:50S ribosomal protein L6 [Anaerolineaceae bacterium]